MLGSFKLMANLDGELYWSLDSRINADLYHIQIITHESTKFKDHQIQDMDLKVVLVVKQKRKKK